MVVLSTNYISMFHAASSYQTLLGNMLASIEDISGKAFDYIVIGRLSRSFMDARSANSYTNDSQAAGRVQLYHELTGCGSEGFWLTQTAGLVVAVRLTEDPTINVLVLEAGEANLDDPVIRECL